LTKFSERRRRYAEEEQLVGLPERTELSLARPKHQYVLPDDLKSVRLVRRRKGGRELVSLRFFRALDTIVDLPLTSDGLASMMRVLSVFGNQTKEQIEAEVRGMEEHNLLEL
jgi:hypothetical protein